MKLRLVDNNDYVDEPVYKSFEEFVNRNQINDEISILSVAEILQQILENQQQIRYYLNEIEMFIPRTKDARFKKKS